jgi:putative transposase
VLQDAQAGDSVQDLCRQHGILDAPFLTWHTTYAGLAVSDVKTLRQLEKENRQLKQMVVEQALDIQALKAITAKTGTAQSETDCRHVAGGTRWAESTTSVSVSDTGSKYAPVPESSIRRPRAPGEDARIAETKRRHGSPRILCGYDGTGGW